MLRDVPQERDPLADTRVTEGETNQAKATLEQVFGRMPERALVTAYWLIAKNENGRLEILASGPAGREEAVAVFSHEEEAEMFLRLWERGCDGWQVRASSAGELIATLYGPCADVERVALDPLPEMVLERTIGLVSMGREHFVDFVLVEREQSHRHEEKASSEVD